MSPVPARQFGTLKTILMELTRAERDIRADIAAIAGRSALTFATALSRTMSGGNSKVVDPLPYALSRAGSSKEQLLPANAAGSAGIESAGSRIFHRHRDLLDLARFELPSLSPLSSRPSCVLVSFPPSSFLPPSLPHSLPDLSRFVDIYACAHILIYIYNIYVRILHTYFFSSLISVILSLFHAKFMKLHKLSITLKYRAVC